MKETVAPSMYSESVNLAQLIAQAAHDKLAHDLVALDVREHFPLADIFLIASAPTDRQVRAISDHIEEVLAEHGYKPLCREGYTEGSWVLNEYEGVISHIQIEQTREFYALERLWQDCPPVPLNLS